MSKVPVFVYQFFRNLVSRTVFNRQNPYPIIDRRAANCLYCGPLIHRSGVYSPCAPAAGRNLQPGCEVGQQKSMAGMKSIAVHEGT